MSLDKPEAGLLFVFSNGKPNGTTISSRPWPAQACVSQAQACADRPNPPHDQPAEASRRLDRIQLAERRAVVIDLCADVHPS